MDGTKSVDRSRDCSGYCILTGLYISLLSVKYTLSVAGIKITDFKMINILTGIFKIKMDEMLNTVSLKLPEMAEQVTGD